MEPLKIQIELSLSDKTIEILQRCTLALAAVKMTQNLDEAGLTKDSEVKEAADQVMNDARDLVASAGPKKQPKTAEPAEVAAEPIQPIELVVITDDELAKKTRETVARLKAVKKSPTIVKTVVFKEFGIGQSSECPKEKRQALMDALDRIAEGNENAVEE